MVINRLKIQCGKIAINVDFSTFIVYNKSKFNVNYLQKIIKNNRKKKKNQKKNTPLSVGAIRY